MLPDTRIAEIERLRAGVTNKPLRARKARDSSGDYAILTYDEGPDGAALLLAEVFEQIGRSKVVDASFLAAFIAAAPAIVDDLLAERKELIERNAKLLKVAGQWIEDDLDRAEALAGKGE